MIKVAEAREFLVKNRLDWGQETLELAASLHRITSTDLVAPFDHPFFDQSAVDGYALRFSSVPSQENGVWKVVAEVSAGQHPDFRLGDGEAARIFTGGQLPAGADTVVMQEHISKEGDRIRIVDARLKPGANVRLRGEQLQAGALALPSGTRMNAAAMGFLASIGIREVAVARQPRITILVTGNEFLQAGESPGEGKISESNGLMLQALLAQAGLNAGCETVKDEESLLQARIAHHLPQTELLLITGGASVGDYDFTARALAACGFTTCFHGVAQKPGKPLLFARRPGAAAFGLPGNPRAVFICFYLYVREYLSLCAGAAHQAPVWMPLLSPFTIRDGKTQFLSVSFAPGGVQFSSGQASHMLQSLVAADGIAELSPEKTEYAPGDLVPVYLLP